MLDPDVAKDHLYFYDWDAHKAKEPKVVFWTPERMDELSRLWPTRLTAAQIGQHMGCTKMAVIGKANRMGLTPRDPVAFTPPLPRRRRAA